MRDDGAYHYGGPAHLKRGERGADPSQHGYHPGVEHPLPQLRRPFRAGAGVQQRLREVPAPHEHRVRGRAEHQQVQRQPLRDRRHLMRRHDDSRRQQVCGYDRTRHGVPEHPRPPSVHVCLHRHPVSVWRVPGQALRRPRMPTQGPGRTFPDAILPRPASGEGAQPAADECTLVDFVNWHCGS